MKIFKTPNSKNIIAIVTIEKPDFAFLLISPC